MYARETTRETDASRDPGADAGGRRRIVPVDGRRVCYATYGAPSGRPAVFLHGTPGSRVLGELFDEPARRRGVRLLAPDRPGYGRSSPRPDRTPVETAADVVAVMDDAGVDHADVVCFSGGTRCAFALAATHGERVDRLDVVSGATPPSARESTAHVLRFLETLARRSPRLLCTLFSVQRWLGRRVSARFVLSQYTTDGAAAVPDDVRDVALQDFDEALVSSCRGAVTESRRISEPWGVALDELSHPVRLWHGGRDANVPVDAARRLGERLPDGELTVFEDADHLGALARSRGRVFAAT